MIRFSSSCLSWLKRFVGPSGGCQSDLSPDNGEEEDNRSNKRGGWYQFNIRSYEEELVEEEEDGNRQEGGCQSDLSPDEKEEEDSNKRGGGCQSDLSSEEEEEDKFMEPSGKIVINISSDDEEEGHSSKSHRGGCHSNLKQQIKEEFDDDCVILDGDPNKPIGGVGNESGSESDELVIVAEKGQVACRDYPHARHLCARFPFNTNPHEKYCALCHCYVCDTLAPCDHWGRGLFSVDHCHATDKEEVWRALRQRSKEGEGARLLALNHRVNTPSNASILHPTTASSEGAQLPPLNNPLNTLSNAPILHPTTGPTTASWEGAQLPALSHPVSTLSNASILHPTTASCEGAQLPDLNHPVNTPSNARILHPTTASCEGAQLPALNHPVNTLSNARILHPTTASCEGAQLPALNHPVNTPSNAPILHPTTGWEAEGRAVTVGLMVTAFDQLTVQTDRLTGTIKWFDWRRGYGFITPDSGDEDLFVHRSSIKSAGYRNLAEGDAVEFRIERRDDGRRAAVEVIGLGMSSIQETTTRGSDLIDSRKCYKCGEMGHLARNCVACYNCGKTGHLARNCSCIGSETDGSDSDGSDTGRYNNCSDTCKCYICGQTGHLTRNCVRCYNCGKTGHFARNCSYTGSPTGSNDFDGRGTGRYNYCSDTCECYVCGEAGHLAEDCSHTRNGSDCNDGSDIGRDDLCTDAHQNSCGEMLHFARSHSYTQSESDNNDNQRGNRMIDTCDCYNCGKTGHLARNCPNMGSESADKEDNTGSDIRRGNYRSDTRECYNCGQTGHLARNCSFSEWRNMDTDNNDSETSEGDQLEAQAERLTGAVKWFSKEKGYGFITPDGGGEDVFVHQSAIKSKGYRSLVQGEVIEFRIGRGDDGRKKAVEVTGPGGSFV